MKFSYKAIDQNGQRISGQLEAESSRAAANLLRADALFPIDVNEMGKHRVKFDFKNVLGKVSLIEKITFIKNLAVMLKAGFPISRAIKTLSDQTENPVMTRTLQDVAHRVESGQSLAEAMGNHPKIFSAMFVNVVKVGEVSGNLDQGLLDLSVQLKKDHDLIRKTKGAMIYPIVVVSVMLLVGIIMFTFVLPKLTELFEEFDVELPFVTQMIIKLADFMGQNGVFVLIAFIGLGAGLFTAMKKPRFKRMIDPWVLKIPLIGKIVRFTNVARISRMLGSLMHSGMPILDSIQVVKGSVSNHEYTNALSSAEEMIKTGNPLSSALAGYTELYTPLLVNMIKVGEESGNIEEVLNEIAGFYEDEVDQTVSNLSSILEPVLMVVVGAAVAILAMGLIMPIYNITQSIN